MTRPNPARRATIYDVAQAAGVSHQTVSRVLKDVPGIRPETKERVERELTRLAYRPNRGAIELARASQRRIGVIGYETFESSTAKVMRGINEVANSAGYLLDIVNVDPVADVDSIADQLEQLNASDVAGILATSPSRSVRAALERVRFRMPVYLDVHGDETEGLSGSAAAHMALAHLRSLGHTRIGFVAGPKPWDSADRREAVYNEFMHSGGFAPIIVGRGDWSAASGYAAVAGAPLDGLTALFVANDRMALGVLRALVERGVAVPDELSVIGIDDVPEAAYFQPPLSTVRIDFLNGGRVAAQTLIQLIERPDAQSPNYPQPSLVVRDSTAPPNRT